MRIRIVQCMLLLLKLQLAASIRLAPRARLGRSGYSSGYRYTDSDSDIYARKGGIEPSMRNTLFLTDSVFVAAGLRHLVFVTVDKTSSVPVAASTIRPDFDPATATVCEGGSYNAVHRYFMCPVDLPAGSWATYAALLASSYSTIGSVEDFCCGGAPSQYCCSREKFNHRYKAAVGTFVILMVALGIGCLILAVGCAVLVYICCCRSSGTGGSKFSSFPGGGWLQSKFGGGAR